MFITFEGLDFCGKSTQVELLKNYLIEKGEEVFIIREPGGTEISEKIRDILLDKKNSRMTIETEVLLFSASRSQLVREVIIPKLRRGVYVISDRFHDSTTAYQGYGRGISMEYVEMINKLAIGEAVPDLTFFVDLSLDEIRRRKSKIEGLDLDRIEASDTSFYEKVREGYNKLFEKEERFVKINGSKTIEQIHDEIVKRIKELDKKASERFYE
jgi:dTMP kinase